MRSDEKAFPITDSPVHSVRRRPVSAELDERRWASGGRPFSADRSGAKRLRRAARRYCVSENIFIYLRTETPREAR